MHQLGSGSPPCVFRALIFSLPCLMVGLMVLPDSEPQFDGTPMWHLGPGQNRKVHQLFLPCIALDHCLTDVALTAAFASSTCSWGLG